MRSYRNEALAMLHEFLSKNQKEVLAMTEKKSLDLAGIRPSSDQLKEGLPIFYRQLMEVLSVERPSRLLSVVDKAGMVRAAANSNEPEMARAGERPSEACLAVSAGLHGAELHRLGYTLSHVVHAYGAMCQSITELAAEKKALITATEFHDLNRCLDLAIAGAVTEYQSQRNTQVKNQEVEQLGFLSHELRNALTSVNISLTLIKRGTVGFGGNTGQVLDRGLKRIEELVDRSLTEVRLRVDPKVHSETIFLLQLIDQILVTAEIEANEKKQIFDVRIASTLSIEVDQQLFYSALSNLIQNAIKYTRVGGKIQVRGNLVGLNTVIEVEGECGGLPLNVTNELFKPYEQRHADRKGLGLGLAIALRAIELNHGTIEVEDLPKKGCIFKITLPGKHELTPSALKAGGLH